MNLKDIAKFYSYDPETGVIQEKLRSASDFSQNRYFDAHIKRVKYGCEKIAGNYKIVRIKACGREFHFMSHRLAWTIYYGEPPCHYIDHINGNGYDNRIKNLRDVTHKINRMNSKLYTPNKTGLHGVFKEKGRNQYTVSFEGRRVARTHDFFEAACIRKSLEVGQPFHENHGRHG